MVVASTGWVQNANFPDNQSNSNVNSTQGNKMTAKGILICRDNSHPFQQRTLTLDQPVKIGRSVARARAAPNNAIFDCKVLSRNHALLWYSKGKFYLQDTQSSNGTFVNNQRLSASGKDSPPKEVCSGDIVQFGVDVIENIRKVTHGCIVATLKLYLPDEKEAKASPSTSVALPTSTVSLEELYKLNEILEEVWKKEKGLRTKLGYLKQLVDNTRSAAVTSWKSLIAEDRLLSWVDTVENQLAVYSKKYTTDKLRNELVKLHEEKAQYQNAAKEALEKILQEKLKVTQRVDQLEGRLSNREVECMSLHNEVKFTQAELEEICRKYTQTHEQLQETMNKLSEAEDKIWELQEPANWEKQELLNKLEEEAKIQKNLRARLNNYRLTSVYIHMRITDLRNYMETLQDLNSKVVTNERVDSKDEENPMEAINTILNILNSIHADNSDLDAEINNSSIPDQDNQINLQEIDSNQLKNSSLSFTKSPIQDSIVSDNAKNDYISPPSSRRTLINGNENGNGNGNGNENGNENGNVENSDLNSEADTISDSTDDACTIISEDTSEKLQIEAKKEEVAANLVETAVSNRMEVRFLCVESEDQHLEAESVADGRGKANLAAISVDRSNDNVTNAPCPLPIVEDETEKVDEDSKQTGKEMKEAASVGGEHLEGDYVKTLKPSSKNEATQQYASGREYVLQTLINSLESLKGADDLEAVQAVNKELEELKEWFLRESHDVIIQKLKELYYKTKNEAQGMQEVNEELVILKEKYNAFVEEKAELSRKHSSLKAQCGDPLHSSYTVPIYYVAPIVIMLMWMLLEKLF